MMYQVCRGLLADTLGYARRPQQDKNGRLILIHSGNTGANTEGCLMPGGTKSTGTVGASKPKLNEIRTYINSKGAINVNLNIYNIIQKK